MRISDWSSDVCSSDLVQAIARGRVDRTAIAVLRQVEAEAERFEQVALEAAQRPRQGGAFAQAFAHLSVEFVQPGVRVLARRQPQRQFADIEGGKLGRPGQPRRRIDRLEIGRASGRARGRKYEWI